MAPTAAKKASKPGPRPRGPFEGKRKTLTTRITGLTRKRLEDAARDAERSLSQEIEMRLEHSFVEDLGSEFTRKLMRALALAKEMAEMTTGKSAFKDKETAQATCTAMIAILNAILPVGPVPEKDQIEPHEGQEAIIQDPQARSLGDNIRDAILEGLGSNLSAIRSSFTHKK